MGLVKGYRVIIADTPNGFEVRDDAGRVVFGPASEVEAEAFVLDAVWGVTFTE